MPSPKLRLSQFITMLYNINMIMFLGGIFLFNIDLSTIKRCSGKIITRIAAKAVIYDGDKKACYYFNLWL